MWRGFWTEADAIVRSSRLPVDLVLDDHRGRIADEKRSKRAVEIASEENGPPTVIETERGKRDAQ